MKTIEQQLGVDELVSEANSSHQSTFIGEREGIHNNGEQNREIAQHDATELLVARADATVDQLGIREEYPFEHKFVETTMGAMHYVDEGRGDPVLALHGNPSWSFLYRKFIKGLSGQNRVIAPDHIGFGLSDMPSDESAYSLEAHIQNMEKLVLELDLRNTTLVVQDWGGPIGLGVAARHPDRFKALVVLNTFGFYPLHEGIDPENQKLPLPLLLMRSRGLGTWLVRKKGVFEGMLMKMATGNSSLKAVHHAYKGVFQGSKDRAGVMAFPRLIPTKSRHAAAQILINETGPFLDDFDGPAQIYWGMKDPFFPVEALGAWKKRLPQADVVELPNAKHYLQEDAPEIIVPGIAKFLNANIN
jgi:pimeloyl-ACP methyl ester carboxylesterase